MSSKKIGVGVVGTGMAAKPHALALNDLSDIINVKAIYSRNKDKCYSFARNYNLPLSSRDDYIVICSTGAYGESMSSNYNLRNSLKSYFSDTI